nr:hypothetical protein [bacterium]
MDSRLQEVENYRRDELDRVTNLYDNMVNNTDQFYQAQKQAAQDYANTQQQLQQANTDFTIEKINQEKEQAQKDYTREQKGAYADYQKASNDYGYAAEQMASAGYTGSGVSETSRLSMYNTYQNRVATAKDSYDRAVLNYNNSIKEAQLQNNTILAEIAYKALQTQLELDLQGFQYKNTLLENQLNQRMNVESMYNTKWQQVYDQMNNERDYAERVREFNEEMALSREQFNWQKSNSSSYSSGGSSGAYYDLSDGGGDAGSQYGYFSNGYQPKGISGYGQVSKTGKTITIVKKNGTLNNQNVWKTPDGTRWYWDGDSRTYKVFNGKSDVIVL